MEEVNLVEKYGLKSHDYYVGWSRSSDFQVLYSQKIKNNTDKFEEIIKIEKFPGFIIFRSTENNGDILFTRKQNLMKLIEFAKKTGDKIEFLYIDEEETEKS